MSNGYQTYPIAATLADISPYEVESKKRKQRVATDVTFGKAEDEAQDIATEAEEKMQQKSGGFFQKLLPLLVGAVLGPAAGAATGGMMALKDFQKRRESAREAQKILDKNPKLKGTVFEKWLTGLSEKIDPLAKAKTPIGKIGAQALASYGFSKLLGAKEGGLFAGREAVTGQPIDVSGELLPTESIVPSEIGANFSESWPEGAMQTVSGPWKEGLSKTQFTPEVTPATSFGFKNVGANLKDMFKGFNLDDMATRAKEGGIQDKLLTGSLLLSLLSPEEKPENIDFGSFPNQRRY